MMNKKVLNTLPTLLAGFLFFLNIFTFQVPVSVKEQEVVANYRTERRNDGAFRADGSDETFDYCIEGEHAGCYYNPQPGDRVNVGYWQGWRLTFWNVGEMGGESKKLAKLEKITEFFTAGDIITEVLPPENKESLASGITYSKILTEPADPADILDPWINPKYTFTLGYTGGPNGVFYEIDGVVQHPNGKPMRGEVIQQADGTYAVQMSGAFNALLKIDDPAVFDGFKEAPPNMKVEFESEYAYGFSDWTGEVSVEPPAGYAETAEEFDLSDPQGMRIQAGSTIKTGSDSYAVVVLDSAGSYLILGPNSEMKIKKPEYGFFDTANGRALMKIKRNIELMIKEGTMEIIMNQAVAGRKGTTAVLVEEEGISSIKVLEGEMYLRSKATNESKDILPGQMAAATSDGLSEVTQFDIEAELATWEQVVPKRIIDEVREVLVSDQPAIQKQEETGTPGKSILKPIYWLGIIPVVILLLVILLVVRQKRIRTRNS